MAAPIYSDLKVEWKGSPDRILELVDTALALGYERLAFNNHMEELKGGKGKKQKEKNEILPGPAILLNAETVKALQVRGRKFEQLSRLTAVLQDASNTHRIASPEVQTYDLIAVQPTDEKTFQLACSTLEIDIICLNLSENLGFVPKRPLVRLAAERGVHFEVSYSPALHDSSVKRNILSSARTLVNAAGGRNIILCSGAQEALDLRSPYDAINLAKLLGLSGTQAKDAITRNCRAVLKHAESRKTSKSVVSVCQLSSLPARERRLVQAQIPQPVTTGDESADPVDEDSEGADEESEDSDEEEEEPPPMKKLKAEI